MTKNKFLNDLRHAQQKIIALYHGDMRPAHERTEPVRSITQFSAPVLLIFAIFNHAHGFVYLAITQVLIVVVLMLPTYLLLQDQKWIGLCEALTMLAAFISLAALIIFGGYLGTGINWAFIFPFLAFYINQQRDAWHWVGAFFVFMVACTILSHMHAVSTYYLPGQLEIFCSTYLFYVFLAFTLIGLRNQYDLKLERQVAVRLEDLKTANQQLEHRLLYDAVTDIPNRYLFDTQLQNMLNHAKTQHRALSVLAFEVNHFQNINNTLGYHNGDSVLQQTVNRAQHLMRSSDIFARIGGANFAIALPNTTTSEAANIAKELFKVTAEPFFIEGNLIELSLRVGIATFPDHADQTNLLLQRADIAMRESKASILNEAMQYRHHMSTCNIRHLRLFGKLRQAITDQKLNMVYQAKVDFSTNEISSVEALVRWHDEEEGFISPEEFIPLAEKSGLILPLTQWILAECIRQCAKWHRKGIMLAISINISTRDLMHRHFQQGIVKLLQKHHLDAKYITLEITETSLMEQRERAMQVLQHLHDMGLGLSIDDFGTGYSSLSYLKELPVHELKIDQSFIFHLGENKSDAMIVQSTINLAHDFGLKVVAEGIESIENMTILKHMGCDKAQGYFMNRPLDAAAFEAWLKNATWPYHKRY